MNKKTFPYIIWNNGDGSATVKYYESEELRDYLMEAFLETGDIYSEGELVVEAEGNISIINLDYRDELKVVTREQVLYEYISDDYLDYASSLLAALFSDDIRNIKVSIGDVVKRVWTHYPLYEILFDGKVVGLYNLRNEKDTPEYRMKVIQEIEGTFDFLENIQIEEDLD